MRDKAHNRRFWSENVAVIVGSILIVLVIMIFRAPLHGLFGHEKYVGLHLIMEFFIVTMAFMIAIQSWMIFPHTLSNFRLWIGASFFAITLLEIGHGITYKGMPFFISESSTYKATWLFIIARLTQVCSLLLILVWKDRLKVTPHPRWLVYTLAFGYSLVWLVLIFLPTPIFPDLVHNGLGTTGLKNGLQYVGIAIELIIVVVLGRRFMEKKDMFHLMMLVAFVYLIIADYLFTTYQTVYDISNFMGHIFQICGFYFMQRAVYHTAVVEPFQAQKKVEEELKAITEHMGEGLLALDNEGRLTYMNPEAERILKWTQHELQQEQPPLEAIQLCKKERSFSPVATSNRGTSLDPNQASEGWVTRQDGQLIPVSYVETPLYEADQITGKIIVLRDISQQKKDQECIHYMAYYDELTGLPNHRYVKDKLTDRLQSNESFALLALDIDRFRNMNEALGHSSGDLILQSLVKRIQESLDPSIFFGRLRGDQFALIVPKEQLCDKALSICAQIEEGLAKPLQVRHLLLKMTVRIGVALYPQDGEEAGALLQRANMALTEAKQKKSLKQFFQPFMDGKALNRLVLENDLFEALQQNQLSLVYQPQVNLITGRIEGLEALLRWRHPQHGWIPPDQFIPIAEDTGLMIPIGEWVLRSACQQAKLWQESGLGPLDIAVNLSTRQFYAQNLAETIGEILEEAGVHPANLELEITESMMMNVEHAQTTLQALKKLGCKIAIDDFGKGYSSLYYLRHLPIDRLKIDRSFIRDLEHNHRDDTIVSTIISMAEHLQLEVIAEGVETIQQSEALRRKQCYRAQGYLFSPPLTPELFVQQFSRLMISPK
ncbi:diguanylate cyclase [Ammoniphilus oxalaticus]|uniref:Diguanylate cyclase n=1 Tax=Ammoniphilus oxalaticus TaxID=66863 RepID=A0A419SKE6_9BACL|nr:EAL domain-containing protein [Ammoniphilus oxalaticus]RKD24430.1 diguanylate cyclase [Ammoniphilus oxalaticus]